MSKIFVINPGSTSTKVGLFEDGKAVFKVTVEHDAAELKKFAKVADQLDYRAATIEAVLAQQGVSLEGCDGFSGRGGGIEPSPGGTYLVTDLLLQHVTRGIDQHPATLGSQLAKKFADQYGVNAYIVNSPDTDELSDAARITGFADMFRTSNIHMLNQRETAIRAAEDLGTAYEKENFIVAHLGGGISISAHDHGRVVDSNSNLMGEGPMAPTRSGALPALQLMDLCYSGKWTRDEMFFRITKNGGFVDHLGTADARTVRARAEEGDQYAALIWKAFLYQIAKQIGAMAVTLKGDVKAILLTGGIAHDKGLVDSVKESCDFIAPVLPYPGEFELEALAAGVERVLSGKEEAKIYTGQRVFRNFDALKKH